jgi:hypothetical protein
MRHTNFIIDQLHGIVLSLFHPLTGMHMLSLSLGSFSLFRHFYLFHQLNFKPNLLLSFIFYVFLATFCFSLITFLYLGQHFQKNYRWSYLLCFVNLTITKKILLSSHSLWLFPLETVLVFKQKEGYTTIFSATRLNNFVQIIF